MRTALSILVVLLSLAPLRADDGLVLFSDDFSTLKPDWGDTSSQKYVSGNNLVLKASVNASLSNVRLGNNFKDADIRVNVQETDGGTDETAGVVFWAADTDNYYLAQITPGGLVGVTRLMQDRALNPVSYAASDAVKKGVGQVNALRVLTVGNSATFYVNGKQVASFRGFPPAQGSRIGLHGESGKTVYTWQFSGLEVRQPPAAQVPAGTAAADPSVIFADNFSKLDPAWGSADGEQSLAGGKLVLQPAAHRSYTSLYQGSFFSDADVRVKISEASGAADETAGLVFWASDYSNYYVAQCQADGMVGVTRWTHGQQVTPVGYAPSDAVVKGVGQVNELRVVTVGKQAMLYVNGRQIATFKGFPPAQLSKIGLHAESGDKSYTWQFSDFEVRQPAAAPVPAVAAAAADASLLFQGDFSTLDPGWGTADGQQSVAGGSLYFQPAVGTSYTSLYQGAVFGDMDFRVKITETSGGPDQPVGVVFWASDYGNLYTAQIRGDGSAGISQSKQGKWQGLVRYTVQNAVAQGVGQANELRIVTQGKQATFYVNGQQIATIQGSPPDGGSKIGLRAVSGNAAVYTWQFSDFTVRKP